MRRTAKQFIEACKERGVYFDVDHDALNGDVHTAPIGFLIKEVEDLGDDIFESVIEAIGIHPHFYTDGTDRVVILERGSYDFKEISPESELGFELFRIERIV